MFCSSNFLGFVVHRLRQRSAEITKSYREIQMERKRNTACFDIQKGERLNLIGAAILVLRISMALQAAPDRRADIAGETNMRPYVILALVLGVTGIACDGSTSVGGRVLDPTGKPILDADVKLICQPNDSRYRRTSTAKTGDRMAIYGGNCSLARQKTPASTRGNQGRVYGIR
jgi:hypothetical protein